MITNNVSPTYVQIFRNKVVVYYDMPRAKNFAEAVKNFDAKKGDIAFFSPIGNHGTHCARIFDGKEWHVEYEYIARKECGLLKMEL